MDRSFSQQYCRGGADRLKFGNYTLEYIPGESPEDEFGGTLTQYENLDGPLTRARERSIGFGKRFIANVSEVLEEIEKAK